MLGGDMKIMTRSKAEHKLISGNLVSCEQIVAWCEIYDTSHHNLCLPSRGQPTPTLHGIKSQQRDPDFEHQSSTQQNTATQTSLSLQTQQPKHHFHSNYSLFTTTDSRTQQPKHHFHSEHSNPNITFTPVIHCLPRLTAEHSNPNITFTPVIHCLPRLTANIIQPISEKVHLHFCEANESEVI